MPEGHKNNMGLKIVFAGTPDFADMILKTLLNHGHEIQAVFTQPDRPAGRGKKIQMSPVKQTALAHNLPTYQPVNFKSETSVEILRALEPDLMLVVAYGLILPKAVLSIPKMGCLNVHASLLPRWRGAAPIQRAIIAGDKVTGISIMAMDEGLDTGPIYSTKDCAISENDTGQSLHDKLAYIGADALLKTLNELEKNPVTPRPQDKTGITYAHKLNKNEARISWQNSADAIAKQVRAFNPWPIAFTQIEKTIVRVWGATISQEEAAFAKPGKILSLGNDGISVATNKGTLTLSKLQMPGKKPCHAAELARGYPSLFNIGGCFSE